MNAMLNVTTLALATLVAAAAAVAVHWLLLRVAFQLMQPAAARRALPLRAELARGTVRVARAFGAHR